MMGERLRRSGAVRVRSLACGVLCAALMGTSAVQAGEALRLLLVNDAEATVGECIRGTLFVVQGFSEADVSHGVRIADTLEIPAASQVLAEGVYTGSVLDENPSGWSIELAPGGVALRAHPAGELADSDAAVFLGRRAGKSVGHVVELGLLMRSGGHQIVVGVLDVVTRQAAYAVASRKMP